MVFFVPFVSVFIYDWKAHISFFPYVPFLCSSTVFFPSFLSIFCFYFGSTTTLLLAPSPLTNFLLLHSPFYTRETYYNSSFLDLFLQGEKQLLAWPKYLDFLWSHLAKLLMKRNLTSWALIQKSSGQVQRAPSSFPTLLATMHFGSMVTSFSLDWCCQCISSSLFSFLTLREKIERKTMSFHAPIAETDALMLHIPFVQDEMLS